MNSTIPLDEALPWSPKTARNILICDTVESDGRFLLSAMAAQALKNNNNSNNSINSIPTRTSNSDKSHNTTNNNGSSKVFWLSCGPMTDRQVATALRKIGSESAAAYLRDTTTTTTTSAATTTTPTTTAKSSGNLTIQSLGSDIAAMLLTSETTSTSASSFDPNVWLRGIYKNIKKWIQETTTTTTTTTTNSESNNGAAGISRSSSSTAGNSAPSWIILDDVSSLSTLLGEALVFQFLDNLLSFALHLDGARDQERNFQNNGVGIIIRCSQDLDYTLYKRAATAAIMGGTNNNEDKIGCLGFGGLAQHQSLKINMAENIPWERCLASSSSSSKVDAIVDVLPLTSGYSREAHGRLIFSECPTGRGWGDESKKTLAGLGTRWNEFLINYCLTESGVRAIRLRGSN